MNTLIYQYIDIHIYACQLNQKKVLKNVHVKVKKTLKNVVCFPIRQTVPK